MSIFPRVWGLARAKLAQRFCIEQLFEVRKTRGKGVTTQKKNGEDKVEEVPSNGTGNEIGGFFF